LLFVLFYVLFVCKCVLPPGDNPTAVNKYIKYINFEFIHLFYNETFESFYEKNYQEFFADDTCAVPKCVGQLTTCGEYL